MDQVVNLLEALTLSPWFLPLIFALALLDAVFPVVPSETAVILGGVAAGFGDLPLAGVILAGALGSMVGDSVSYDIGHRFGRAMRRRQSKRMKSQLEWARHALARRAGTFILSARFIPGGRTAITLTSGLTGQPRPRFTVFVVIAGVVWGSYAAGLGFFFGRQFHEDRGLAFLLAFGVALAVVAAAEAGRWLLRRRSAPVPSGGEDRVQDDTVEVA